MRETRSGGDRQQVRAGTRSFRRTSLREEAAAIELSSRCRLGGVLKADRVLGLFSRTYDLYSSFFLAQHYVPFQVKTVSRGTAFCMDYSTGEGGGGGGGWSGGARWLRQRGAALFVASNPLGPFDGAPPAFPPPPPFVHLLSRRRAQGVVFGVRGWGFWSSGLTTRAAGRACVGEFRVRGHSLGRVGCEA